MPQVGLKRATLQKPSRKKAYYPKLFKILKIPRNNLPNSPIMP
jgi:hypothetical protein